MLPGFFSTTTQKGTILLIHGWPQTSYQFRHVISPLTTAGYRLVIPDYRGAGQSSKPASGYDKITMATDLHTLVREHLGFKEKIHIVGHDIGGMIAYAYATRFADHVASVVWGECPLPGTTLYDEVKRSDDVFHFLFHRVLDLPEALVAGRERVYIRHFFDKQSFNTAWITQGAMDVYASAFEQPGAMRAGFEIYRAFERDAAENREWWELEGKCGVPALGLVGGEFLLKGLAGEMMEEGHVEGAWSVRVVEGSGHYVAEEQPEGFAREVLGFVGGIELESCNG
ncbi:alpha/beta-hydrolase [Mytilinidion resinicola]|uniref:Alpha/beta-hydrolase n=1 Tax=Mytilinidion resinicola TaxID=574789 RepID=A0A6A6Z9H9_9PEZI|nr:alpha/beta-hydrolase [Mytilinidion resinicola]KAF2817781.1 alpha/beta-hydrolase [Mytilinidion resinicola]